MDYSWSFDLIAYILREWVLQSHKPLHNDLANLLHGNSAGDVHRAALFACAYVGYHYLTFYLFMFHSHGLFG